MNNLQFTQMQKNVENEFDTKLYLQRIVFKFNQMSL